MEHVTLHVFLTLVLVSIFSLTSRADSFDDALAAFRSAGESGKYFDSAYGYALFPTIGKGGIGGRNDAATAHLGYRKGMAVFTIARGGLMYEATLGGQKFSYTPL